MIYDTSATTSRRLPARAFGELMGRIGHSTTRAALIYKHRTT
jgi:hypothetical protein